MDTLEDELRYANAIKAMRPLEWLAYNAFRVAIELYERSEHPDRQLRYSHGHILNDIRHAALGREDAEKPPADHLKKHGYTAR